MTLETWEDAIEQTYFVTIDRAEMSGGDNALRSMSMSASVCMERGGEGPHAEMSIWSSVPGQTALSGDGELHRLNAGGVVGRPLEVGLTPPPRL